MFITGSGGIRKSSKGLSEKFMGRFHRKNKKPRTDRDATPAEARPDGGYPEHKFVRENAEMEAYYRMQGLIPEEEFDQFMASLKEVLPSTFRLTGTRQSTAGVQEHLEAKLIPSLPKQAEDGSSCPVPEQLKWYPGGLAWNMKSDRRAIRSQPAYARFHDWLKAAMENGDISRQEAVSMVPPLLMDVKPDHLVLDLCAAPGSKTSQIVEAMHAACAPGELPTGLVIANDLDQKRAYLLHHQVKRILSPCLMVTNNDGTLFPNLYGLGSDTPLRFDRILADVPCTGDGTIRKNPGVWKEWKASQALGLHPLQVRLLERAVQMAKVGGRIVYSTCSMNPIEDEAVVATILARFPGKLRLVDCSSDLNGLKRLAGVTSWKVASRDIKTVYASHDEVPEAEKSRYPLSVFPQTEYADLGLEHCMRILPHLQDTGGFFIAVIEKVDEIGTASGRNLRQATDETEAAVTGFYANPNEGEYKLASIQDHPNMRNIVAEYGLNTSVLERYDCAFVSKSQTAPLKSIVMISSTAARLLQACNTKLRVVNLGARSFEIYDVSQKRQMPCPYRILTESAPLFEDLQLVGRRRIEVPPAMAIKLINHDDSVSLESLEADADLLARIREIPEGGIILVARSSVHPVVIPSWKGEKSIKAFVPKPNRPALLYQLGVHDD